MSIVFVLPNIPNPRMNKRIAVAKKITTTQVICVRRESQNLWEPYYSDVEHIIYDMDLPTSDHIFRRFIKSLQFHKAAFNRLISLCPKLIYADGFDALCIAAKYKRKDKNVKIVYEMADIRESFIEKPKSIVKKMTNYILRYSEKIKIRDVNYLIVTSEKFYSEYYKNLIKREKTIFIPNTPELKYFQSYRRKENGDFSIGFIGGIRYLRQMKMLVDAAEIAGVNVLFAGAGGTDKDYENIKAYCEGKTHVEFSGKYDYAKEIAELYGRVDCIYAVYDASNANVRIALPNKLYEAIVCELPIIVAKGTYLSEIVETWEVGPAVAYNDVKELVSVIKRMATEKDYYNLLCANCHKHQKDIDIEIYNKKMKKIFTELLA